MSRQHTLIGKIASSQRFALGFESLRTQKTALHSYKSQRRAGPPKPSSRWGLRTGLHRPKKIKQLLLSAPQNERRYIWRKLLRSAEREPGQNVAATANHTVFNTARTVNRGGLAAAKSFEQQRWRGGVKCCRSWRRASKRLKIAEQEQVNLAPALTHERQEAEELHLQKERAHGLRPRKSGGGLD